MPHTAPTSQPSNGEISPDGIGRSAVRGIRASRRHSIA
jgi:hypothetical protein